MEPISFTKGHGTGNDFVVIPDPDNSLTLTRQLVSKLCDRRFGIGGDGVLRVVRTAADPQLRPYADAQAVPEWFMDYRNADGSVAELCGNGIRVFARYLLHHQLVALPELVVGTRTGPVSVVVTEEAVSATMRLPRGFGRSTARIGDRELTGAAVDCGNPHLVCPLPADLPLAEVDLSRPPIVDPAVFPDGANVELIEPVAGELAGPGPTGPEHVRMRVHERGVGETMSCGSGACAAAAVVLAGGIAPGLVPETAPAGAAGVVTVDVPGGRLTVALTAEDCALTGAAVLVAEGTVSPEALLGAG